MNDEDGTVTIFSVISITVPESPFRITEFDWLQMSHMQCNDM